jgi:hypothetical protein
MRWDDHDDDVSQSPPLGSQPFDSGEQSCVLWDLASVRLARATLCQLATAVREPVICYFGAVICVAESNSVSIYSNTAANGCLSAAISRGRNDTHAVTIDRDAGTQLRACNLHHITSQVYTTHLQFELKAQPGQVELNQVAHVYISLVSRHQG